MSQLFLAAKIRNKSAMEDFTFNLLKNRNTCKNWMTKRELILVKYFLKT